ncbi:HipA domain-containing protein [Lepagella muris]|uniref:HipA domain-containing protein n=1 Tax=Lepagella muris TaxID=3032870 RepID=UPI003B82D9DF
MCYALTKDMADMMKVYRLMVFNYLIDNRDDHAKNFSFVYHGGKWHFTPAYDLLPSDGINGYRTTSVNNSIDPTDADVIIAAVKAGIDKNEAERIFREMQTIVRNARITGD